MANITLSINDSTIAAFSSAISLAALQPKDIVEIKMKQGDHTVIITEQWGESRSEICKNAKDVVVE